MHRKILKNKPLLEAIFECHWRLKEIKPGIMVDPSYKLLIGSIYDKIKDEYPYYEPLQNANIPDEISEYLVQYRFRKGENKWPLIQLGQGIITLNDTDGYVWEDFEERISFIIDNLFKSFPISENQIIKQLILRYIDAIDFNYDKEDIFSFLVKKMKMNINMYPQLFKNTGVNKSPLDLDLKFTFSSNIPKGAVDIRFRRGKRKNNNSNILIWETMVRSIDDDAPKSKENILKWVNDAHNLTDDWFFKIIEGDLLRRFE